MSLLARFREAHAALWQRMVTHPFVEELGEGTLPLEKSRRYFLQDYLFVRVLAKVVGLAIAKAPSLEAARPLSPFLAVLLSAESDLFVRAFAELGVPPEEYRNAQPLPTTLAFGDFLLTLAHEDSFEEVLTALLVTEGTYAAWARRLVEAGKRPSQRLYQEWIDIHAAQELAEFVQALDRWLTESRGAVALERLQEVFLTALRYEYLFWEMAYHGERWP
jgi:thiaminase/transcriptional activator TenA